MSGETSLDVVAFVLVAALGRKPFGSVAEVVLPMLLSYEVVDAVAGRQFVGVVGDDVELTEPLVVDQQRCPDFGTVPNIAMVIDVSDGFAIRRVSEQLHRIGDYCHVGIGVSFASGHGYRLTKFLEARLSFVLHDLVHAIHHEAVREVPL